MNTTFEQFLQHKDIIPATIKRHHTEVRKYEKWLNDNHDKIPESASHKDLLLYLQYVKDNRKLCNASQNKVLQKLKNYHCYLTQEYGIPNITSFIKIRGANRKHLHLFFTPDELDLLCDSYYYRTQEYKPSNKQLYFYPEQKQLLQGRYIVLTLIVYQALRIQEIERLTQDDFDLRKGTVTIHESRMAAAKVLSLDASQVGTLITYFNNGNESFIPNRNHLEKLNATLKELQPKYHDFRQVRASRITQWIKLYGLRKAQYLAGHKNIRSTEKYLAGDLESLQNDMDNFHPL